MEKNCWSRALKEEEERCTLVIELKFGISFVIRRRRFSGWSLREVSKRRRSTGFGRELLESDARGSRHKEEVGIELSRKRSSQGGKMLR